jgi:hypothetical protein
MLRAARRAGAWPKVATRRWLEPALGRPAVLAHGLCTDTVTERKPRRQPVLTKLGPDATPLELAAEIGKRFDSHDWPSRLMLDNLALNVQTEEEARALFAQHANYVYIRQENFPLNCIDQLLQAYYRGSLDVLFQVLSSSQRYRVFYRGETDREVLPSLVPKILLKLAADGELERLEELYAMMESKDDRPFNATGMPVRLDAEANAALVRSLLEAGHAEAAQRVLRIATEGGAEAEPEPERADAADAEDAVAEAVDEAPNK